MADVFVPHGYASKSFWPQVKDTGYSVPQEVELVRIQPFSVYQLDHPHVIRKHYGHLGVSPRCRASAIDSMDLVRKVLQPAINQDIVDAFKKYVTVFREAANNVWNNMQAEPFATLISPADLDIDNLTYKACCDALEHCKSLFDKRKLKNTTSDSSHQQSNAFPAKHALTVPPVASSLPPRLCMKRVPSPDFPWNKRLNKGSPRRSLSPTPRKRSRPTPTKRYGSPHHGKEPLRRDNWDPDKLTTSTQFVMGTKANKALGLGATRGRIYMKHPELFKYSSDPDDKKWMVKNNCMLATGGKNTFIMIAENIFDLLDNEYKDSPHLQRDEMQLFTLPEFILQKMRALMVKEKKLTQKLTRKTVSPAPTIKTEAVNVKTPPSVSPHQGSRPAESPNSDHATQHHSKRHAAERAAAAISATSEREDDVDELNNQQHIVMGGLQTMQGNSGTESGSEEERSSNHLMTT